MPSTIVVTACLCASPDKACIWTKSLAAALSAVRTLRMSGSGSSATILTRRASLYALAKIAFCIRSTSCRVGRPSSVTRPAACVAPTCVINPRINASLLRLSRSPLSDGLNNAIIAGVMLSASTKAFSLAAIS
ncbi:hypothetical protein FTV93_27035 (plasmid) [Escherichia coli]|uniref:Uncharacterized protein n=1 Tax=Escherichia coli TaxID=562 RepID=A0A5B9AQX7_ECOLX|nr:hypothetical protein FTV93_27035 [Escherichia coli]